ncbi:MAG: alginate lyase family protein, partial [Sphingomonas sp.]
MSRPILALLAAAVPPAAAATLSLPRHETQCRGTEGYAAAFGGRRTFLLRPDQLTSIKAALGHDARLDGAYVQLIAQADAALAHRPGSVVDKTTTPPSGDKHDYMSLAPYWWPNAKTKTGLPYVRRDGRFNPARATAAFDRTAIGQLSDDVRTLSLAYYYSGNDRYAAKVATLVRTWFLDPAWAINPIVRFALSFRGRTAGRAEGVLDTNAFQVVIDGVGLIGPSHHLSTAELAGLKAWFRR